MIRLITIILFLAFIPSAHAISVEDNPNMKMEMPPLPKAKEGSVAWQLFLTTKEKQKKITYPEGGYGFEVTPEFSDTLKELNGKQVTIHGFMFPLEQSEKQSNFLIGPFPPSCPFHYHIPPSLILEVHSTKPIEFSWDEITIKGTLELADKAPNGIYYYLKSAALAK